MTRAALTLFLLLAQEFGESITVSRYVFLVRVVDSRGEAVQDLTAADFAATVGGQPVTVESAEWVEGAVPGTERPQDGRLILFFIQSDFARNAPRIAGQMRFNSISDDVLNVLGPKDRMAVLSYDSHLKLRADFTSDRAVIREAIRDSLGAGRVPLPEPPESGPSLARHLDDRAMRNATNVETALLLMADALAKVEGEKLIVMCGYGLEPRQQPRREWRAAMALLQQHRVPVIVVNTGLGGVMSLGLAATARATGGVYTFVDLFPSQSVTRVAGMLRGSYELVLRMNAPLKPGRHDVRVQTSRRGLSVQGPRSVLVEADEEVETAVVREETAPPPPDVAARRLYVEAMRILQDGRSDGVEALLDAAIAADPMLAEAWYERGMLAAERGDTEAAARDLRKYLELAPNGNHAADAREMLRSF